MLAAVLIAVIASRHGAEPPASSPAMGSQVTANPEVDPGTRLPGTAAPGFTLTNQFGSRVSLSQFRGKAWSWPLWTPSAPRSAR